MKTPPEHHDAPPPDWMRWLDGEMPATERAAFEQQLAADPALRGEVDAAHQLSSLLRQELPRELPVPHADFFNSQIQVRPSQMEVDERRSAAAPPRAGSWWAWLKSPWLVGAAAAAITVLLLRTDPQSSASSTIVTSTYAPNPNVIVSAFHSNEADATVLMLEGLEELPADRKIVGWHLQSGHTDAATLATTFLGVNGEVQAVMTRDARNQPHLWIPRG